MTTETNKQTNEKRKNTLQNNARLQTVINLLDCLYGYMFFLYGISFRHIGGYRWLGQESRVFRSNQKIEEKGEESKKHTRQELQSHTDPFHL